MALTLYSLFKAALLVLNALAVLHPHRFLAKYGLDKIQDGTGVRAQLAGLLHAVRFMRWPLLVVNLLIIVVELLVG